MQRYGIKDAMNKIISHKTCWRRAFCALSRHRCHSSLLLSRAHRHVDRAVRAGLPTQPQADAKPRDGGRRAANELLPYICCSYNKVNFNNPIASGAYIRDWLPSPHTHEHRGVSSSPLRGRGKGGGGSPGEARAPAQDRRWIRPIRVCSS